MDHAPWTGHRTDHRTELRRAYAGGKLTELPVFAGGFINFGFWRAIPLDGPLTAEDRVASQAALYDLVLDALSPTGRSTLEVGCGQGVGARRTLLRSPARCAGVDQEPEQVERARAAAPDAEFAVGSAGSLPFGDGEFERLLSVEAAQHFDDLGAFAREAARVLSPGGRLAVTTFFAADASAAPELSRLLATFASGLDLPHPIGGFLDRLREAGFDGVTATSVGEHVWRGLDRWLELGPAPERWDRNWLVAAERGLLDYHLVTATKPAGSGA
ncbi:MULTISPECIES: class I SAM-dependent methyltransferase [Actinosynnema]|uniref:class I SAM-dependent methyltransferase n=1 Tax=Actinosynnema TaxID=40566 RepID=UPI0020A26B4C|nr:class I SAM-dependent methyltransferase [Actinosynnema pretiosum]MCP2096989.1 Methyltransferase domain-containing protein [Actinosynnema pretiosum]